MAEYVTTTPNRPSCPTARAIGSLATVPRIFEDSQPADSTSVELLWWQRISVSIAQIAMDHSVLGGGSNTSL